MTLKEKCEALLRDWQKEIKGYNNHQFGRCGADDGTMDHGRYDQLGECMAYLEAILESEQNKS